MAQQTDSGGGSAMAFVAGALLIVVAIIAYFLLNGGINPNRQVDVNVSLPRIEQPAVPAIKPPELPTPNIAPR